MKEAALIQAMIRDTWPGCHTYSLASCGHWSRNSDICADCADKALLASGIDVTKGGTQYAFKRTRGGRLRRQLKGTQP
jgi:hypothetical protein